MLAGDVYSGSASAASRAAKSYCACVRTPRIRFDLHNVRHRVADPSLTRDLSCIEIIVDVFRRPRGSEYDAGGNGGNGSSRAARPGVQVQCRFSLDS